MIAYSSGNEHINQSWTVACTRCVCRGATFYGTNSWESISKAVERTDKQAEQKAVDWWNTRAPAISDELREKVLELDGIENKLRSTLAAIRFIWLGKLS
jgi:hypothetical protein